MYFVEVKELPEIGSSSGEKGALKSRLDKFMELGVKIVKIVLDDDDYCCPVSAHSAFSGAVERWAFPIDVKMRKGEVYLIRRDM